MALQLIEFPKTLPDGMEELDDEPSFDPGVHLQLEPSQSKWRLDDFGYSESEISQCPSRLAAAGPFRVLSDEGAAVMLESSRRLEAFKQYTETLAPSVRFPAYRSRFMKDLARNLEVAEFVGEQLEAGLVPHSLTGLALTHLNYTSEKKGVPIDRWHNDAVGVACVMAASDPSQWDGGRFEFFAGTKHEAAELNRNGKPIPPERTISNEFPGPGWATVVQGNRVVHRAGPLNQLAERTTFIICYVASDLSLPEVDTLRPYTTMDPPHIVFTEWARHKAWLARARIDRLLEELPFTDDRQRLIAALEDVRAELDTAIEDIREESVGDFQRFEER